MTTPIVPSASPLTEADFLAVRLASERHKKIKSAARAAAFSSRFTLALAALGVLITVIDFSLWSLIITVGLAVIGLVELRGGRSILRAEPAACRTLALNQLAFLTLIIIYCVFQMATFKPSDLPTELRQLLDPEIMRSLPKYVYGFYLLIIVGSVAFQGGWAIYYYTRRRHVEAFARETPDWIRRQLIELDR